ncbi:MAG TPA: bi-domain-containing oxidoreductase [Streptosporangiaceae bacterium]|nr:bi-domain-containing oxidoreductase [Streptosporangiaceae bacterium]
MKQIAQNYKSGELIVLDVPAPSCRAGGVLVRSLFSLISTGTEMMKLTEAKMSMVGKARARPDQVRKVLDSVAQQGAVSTYKKVMNRLDSYTPLGYSLCGVVTEVGKGAEEFHVGQLVAAAGNEHALHADYNWVPVNLCVPVPASVSPEHAAFATVGAIAMQGVRRAEVQLGDAACVIGLGLVGQLTVRLLVAAGVRVVGLDVIEDRCRLAEKAGALLCAAPTEDGMAAIQNALAEITEGRGADHILLAAGGSSNGPVEAAARLARDRARVVDIGKTRLDLPWNAYYDKELDVRFSRSYGPGRYDDRYELEGIDYPAGYVRWTERRNLACFLDLLAHQDLEVDSLVSGVFPMERATEVYNDLSSGALNAVGVLLEYAAGTADEQAPAMSLSRPVAHSGSGSQSPAPRRSASKQLAVGFIGAGNYASSMLLPHLAKLDAVRLAHVATTRSLSAVNAQRRFGFGIASTAADAVLGDDELDAIFIVTRHHTHADLVCRALQTGKAVFVEKPLGLTRPEVDRIEETIASTGNDQLMVGFNRRFAPLLTSLKSEFAQPGTGSVIRYLVNAGQLESGSWYRDADLEGSRFAGEGGHFIDTLSWWADSLPEEVFAMPGPEPDEVQATLRFAGGSSGVITYTTTGNSRYPKETLDASGGGRTARLDNFRHAAVWTGRRRSATKSRGGQDKGQQRQLVAFVEACRAGTPMPIALDSLLATTRATIAVGESLASGKPEPV